MNSQWIHIHKYTDFCSCAHTVGCMSLSVCLSWVSFVPPGVLCIVICSGQGFPAHQVCERIAPGELRSSSWPGVSPSWWLVGRHACVPCNVPFQGRYIG